MWNPFNRNTISNSSASKRSLQLITQKGMPFAYVEAYKALRTNLNFLSGSGDVHAFVVTSTVPEEAKSNVSVNLALALTESGKKVVLVDCDLRKPVLHRYLKAGHNLKGVSNVLSRQVALSDALVELKGIPNLTFLPAGTTPPNPSELLSQPQMQVMVDSCAGAMTSSSSMRLPSRWSRMPPSSAASWTVLSSSSAPSMRPPTPSRQPSRSSRMPA